MDAPTDRQVLEMAGRDYRLGGSREQAIRDELGLGSTAFWLRVVGILADPDPALAVEFGPLLNRLARRRRAGMRQRSGARRTG